MRNETRKEIEASRARRAELYGGLQIIEQPPLLTHPPEYYCTKMKL
jgi:hypothetical protein